LDFSFTELVSLACSNSKLIGEIVYFQTFTVTTVEVVFVAQAPHGLYLHMKTQPSCGYKPTPLAGFTPKIPVSELPKTVPAQHIMLIHVTNAHEVSDIILPIS